MKTEHMIEGSDPSGTKLKKVNVNVLHDFIMSIIMKRIENIFCSVKGVRPLWHQT